MLNPVLQDLVLRSLGAPTVLLSPAMQGVFRGHTRMLPLYVTGIVVFPCLDSTIFILSFHLFRTKTWSYTSLPF